MKKYIILFILIFPAIVFAQGLYTYSKISGDSVIFAWDYVQIQIPCGTQTVTLSRGQASYSCENITYPLVWIGEDLKVVGGKVGGGDLLISNRYGFQGLKPSVMPEVISVQGETRSNQISIPLSFGEGTFRLRVRAIRTWDGVDASSVFANSDGPNGVVDGVARPWVVQINPLIVACTSFTYSAWSPSICPINGLQTRTVLTSLPAGCVGGAAPVLSQACTYIPPTVVWPGGLKVLP